MRVRDFIVRWSIRLALLALVAGVAFSFRLVRELPTVASKATSVTPTKKEIELCRKLVISSMNGGSLLSLGRVFTRRMRKGPFFLAAREMIIDHLDATLPDSYFHSPTNVPPPPADAKSVRVAPPSFATLKNTLQNGSGSLKDLLPAVVGVTIRGLQISRQADDTSIVPWMSATRASAARGGLVLQNGWSVEQGVTNSWREAFLSFDPILKLHF